MSLENTPSRRPETDYQARQEFMQGSLRALAAQLKSHRYPDYPTMGDRFRGNKHILVESGRLELDADGPWNTGQAMPTDEELAQIEQSGLPTDRFGRPKHPWYGKMATDIAVGLAMGKGFFREWGPNYTADPVIIQAGHVLLVRRGDNGLWTNPGGFRDRDEETGILEDSLEAAIREGGEEAGLDLTGVIPVLIYEGPVADIRMTANAWPETAAYFFDLGDNPELPEVWGGDDADEARWWPIEETRQTLLHGSHNLLTELAWQRFCQNRA